MSDPKDLVIINGNSASVLDYLPNELQYIETEEGIFLATQDNEYIADLSGIKTITFVDTSQIVNADPRTNYYPEDVVTLTVEQFKAGITDTAQKQAGDVNPWIKADGKSEYHVVDGTGSSGTLSLLDDNMTYSYADNGNLVLNAMNNAGTEVFYSWEIVNNGTIKNIHLFDGALEEALSQERVITVGAIPETLPRTPINTTEIQPKGFDSIPELADAKASIQDQIDVLKNTADEIQQENEAILNEVNNALKPSGRGGR